MNIAEYTGLIIKRVPITLHDMTIGKELIVEKDNGNILMYKNDSSLVLKHTFKDIKALIIGEFHGNSKFFTTQFKYDHIIRNKMKEFESDISFVYVSN